MQVKKIRLIDVHYDEAGWLGQLVRDGIEVIRKQTPKFASFLEGLAGNLKEIKQLQPIIVRAIKKDGYVLVAGRKRFAAAFLNGDKTIDAHIYTSEASNPAIAQSENQWRMSLPLSEQWALLQAEVDIEREKAKNRQKSGKKADPEDGGKTLERVGQRRGWSTTKMERVKAICEAEKQNLEHYGRFRQQMDDRGRYYCAWERLQDQKQADSIEAAPIIRQAQENQFVCGDAETILRTIDTGTVDAIITDPPFGMGKVFGRLAGEPDTAGIVEWGHDPKSYWQGFEPILQEMHRVVRPGGLIAIFQSFLYRRYFDEWFGRFGYDEFFVCKRSVDYRKNNRNKKRQSVNDHLGKNDSHACPMIYAIDPIVMMWKKGDRLLMPIEWKGRHRENWTATDMDIDPIGKLYPYSKPISLCEEFIFRWVREKSFIVDPFSGSGAITIAAERLGHRWMGIEFCKNVVKLAWKRRNWHRKNNEQPDLDAWNTPKELFDQLHAVFGFTVDAAANEKNALLQRYWSQQEDALRQDWSKEIVWLNPPYKHRCIEDFLAKAASAKQTVAIVPSDSLTTRYFAKYRPDWIALPQSRVHFKPTENTRGPRHAVHGCSLLIYGTPTKKQLAALRKLNLTCYRNG